MIGHLADALAAGLPIDVLRLIAEAQLSQQLAQSIAAGAPFTNLIDNMILM